MFATRKARLAVVCLLLTTVSTCSRRHESQDFLPSAPSTQNALQITNVGALSVPADGASTLRIEAQISPDANVSRLIRFHTTLGGWLETAAAASSAALRAGAGQGGPRQAELPQEIFREADTSGRAVAFLQSTTTVGTAVVTVSVVKVDDNNEVTDTLASVNREVEFVQVSGALELRVDPEQTFADGISGITLEAEISADSPSSWNMVVFETTLGTLDSLGADPDAESQKTTVPTDGNRIARARLTSTTPGTASVKATIEEFPEASVSRFVTFAGQNPNAITISTSASEIPADGSSQVSVIATLDPSISNREVTFTTSAGQFVSGDITSGNPKETKATADASNQAIVQLQSDNTVNPSVLLTATVNLTATNAQSVNTTIAFVAVAASELSVTPGSLGFGQVTVDTTSDLSVTLGNHGDAALSVTGLSVDPSTEGFSVHLPPSLPLTIQPAGSQAITIRYAPDAEETNSAFLVITSNDPVRPTVSAALAGEGVAAAPNIVVDPTSLAFSAITAAGAVTENMVLEIRNTGTADLDVTDIVSSEGGGVFTPSTTAFTVAPGAAVDVTVTFDPMAVVVYSETLTIESNDPDEPALAVPVSGEGT